MEPNEETYFWASIVSYSSFCRDLTARGFFYFLILEKIRAKNFTDVKGIAAEFRWKYLTFSKIVTPLSFRKVI